MRRPLRQTHHPITTKRRETLVSNSYTHRRLFFGDQIPYPRIGAGSGHRCPLTHSSHQFKAREPPSVAEAEMAGILSRFSSSRSGHRRAQSAVVLREMSPENMEVTDTSPTSPAHGIEAAVEFKPVERPAEPLDRDQPVKCPVPERSILNDARVWKERLSSASARMVVSDLPVVNERSPLESEASGTKPPAGPRRRAILPSISAPEHDLITLLEECNVGGEQKIGY